MRFFLSDALTIFTGQPVVVSFDSDRCYLRCSNYSIGFIKKYLRDRRWDIIARAAQLLEEKVTGKKSVD